jgi:hypothetical protein
MYTLFANKGLNLSSEHYLLQKQKEGHGGTAAARQHEDVDQEIVTGIHPSQQGRDK